MFLLIITLKVLIDFIDVNKIETIKQFIEIYEIKDKLILTRFHCKIIAGVEN